MKQQEITTDKLLDIARKGAKKIGDDFTDPDDDWMPMLFVKTPKGGVVMPLPLEDKNATALALEIALKRAKATAVVMLTPAWTVQLDESELSDDTPAPSEHPNRRECVFLTFVDKDRAGMEIAFIERPDGKPPILGDFEDRTGDFPDDLSGRFIDAMRRGIG